MRWRRLSKVAGFEERSDGGLEVSTFAKALPTLRDAGPPKKKKSREISIYYSLPRAGPIRTEISVGKRAAKDPRNGVSLQ